MTTLVLPPLSVSMETGTVGAWLRREGDEVTAGEPVVEIESDKATMELEAPAAGVLRPLVREGESVPVGTPLAEIEPVGAGAPPPARGGAQTVAAADLRRAVVGAIEASWAGVPHIHIGGELEADGLAAAREQLRRDDRRSAAGWSRPPARAGSTAATWAARRARCPTSEPGRWTSSRR